MAIKQFFAGPQSIPRKPIDGVTHLTRFRSRRCLWIYGTLPRPTTTCGSCHQKLHVFPATSLAHYSAADAEARDAPRPIGHPGRHQEHRWDFNRQNIWILSDWHLGRSLASSVPHVGLQTARLSSCCWRCLTGANDFIISSKWLRTFLSGQWTKPVN